MSTGLKQGETLPAHPCLAPRHGTKGQPSPIEFADLKIATPAQIRAWRRAPTGVGEFASDHLS